MIAPAIPSGTSFEGGLIFIKSDSGFHSGKGGCVGCCWVIVVSRVVVIMVSWDFSIVSALVCGVVVLFWFVLMVCFREVVDAGGVSVD